MKRIVSALVTLAVLAALAIVTRTSEHGVKAVYAQNGCNLATLNGNYGFSIAGFLAHSSGGHGSTNFPFAGEGLGNFDGAGNFTATFAYSFNGTSSTDTSYSATYIVNSDCTGSLTATPGSGGDNFAFVIVSGGAEILATDVNQGATYDIDLKKQ
jgi:hypothetical protein